MGIYPRGRKVSQGQASGGTISGKTKICAVKVPFWSLLLLTLVTKLQALYESVSGVECKGWHPNKEVESGGAGGGSKKELTAEELIEAANLYFDKITETMVSMANSYKSQGKDLKDPQVAQQYQMEASTDANEVAEKALEVKGINMSDFRSAIDKHSRVPSVGQTLGMLQLKQQQELMEAGVPMI